MDTLINYLQRDCSALKRTIENNRTGMNEGGFTEETYTAFTGAMEDLNLKETAQQKAVKDLADKTAVQNEAAANVQKLISDVRAAAKSAYGRNSKDLKLFNIGEAVPATVRNLIPVCSYTVGLVEERKEVLLKNGLKQGKITALAGAPAELTLLDEAQENAKKIKKSRTLERDESAKSLRDQAFKIRNFAKACFSGKPEILIQFNPIPKGRGAGVDEEIQPPQNPTQPAG